MFIPEYFINEVLDRVVISEIIGRDVPLKKQGHEYSGLCPFHSEKSPSFTVNDQKQFYHCFGCGAHGTAATYLTKRHHYSFPEAIQELAQRIGLAMPDIQSTAEEEQKHKHRLELVDVVEIACQFFEAQLHTTSGYSAREYLLKRGLKLEDIKEYRLGYASEGNELLKHMLSKGASASTLIEAGLVIEVDGKPPYDRFRQRVMFPICDSKGKVIAFGGRILGSGEPKYLNSPETPLFHKGETLYGEHFARLPQKEAKPLVLAEGYMDVIALNRSQTCVAVAPLGTAVTEKHLQRLWKMDHDPIICMDGDSAGIRSMWRAAERAIPILKPGVSLRFVKLPDKLDPDDILRIYGPDKLKQLLSKPTALSQFIFDYQQQLVDIKRPEHLAQLNKIFYQLSHKIENYDVRSQYQQFFQNAVKELSSQLKTHAQLKPNSKNGTKNFRSQTLAKPLNTSISPMDPIAACEGQILRLILQYPSLLGHDVIREAFENMEFTAIELDKIRQVILHKAELLFVVPPQDYRRFLVEEGLSGESRLVEKYSAMFFRGLPLLLPDAQQAVWYYLRDLHYLELIKKEVRMAYIEHTSSGEKRAEALSHEIKQIEQSIAMSRSKLEQIIQIEAEF